MNTRYRKMIDDANAAEIACMTKGTPPDIPIPPELVEAVARAIHAKEYDEEHYPFEKEDPVQQRLLRNQATAAIRAMLKAWPGMSIGPNIYGRQNAIIHLPLTENTND